MGSGSGMGRTCYRKEGMKTTQPVSTHVLPEQADTPERRDTGHDDGQRVGSCELSLSAVTYASENPATVRLPSATEGSSVCSAQRPGPGTAGQEGAWLPKDA